MPKKRTNSRTRKKFNLKIFKGKSTSFNLFIVLFALIFATVLVFGQMNLSNLDRKNFEFIYTCCDSGDGANCHPSNTETITYNDPKRGPQVYGLLKTNILFAEGAQHLDDTGIIIPGKGRIILNESSTSTDHYHEAPCTVDGPNGPRTRDLIGVWDNTTKKQVWCDNIEDDEVIYLCKGTLDECAHGTGAGLTDAYFRLSDLQETGGVVPSPISSCRKPDFSYLQEGKQELLLPTYEEPGKKNLQLETFYITSSTPSAEWLSPYCKPAIYLYPEKETVVHVQIKPKGKLTYTLPHYPESGWNVLALPNGDIFQNNIRYDYLYYEAELPDTSFLVPNEGFVTTYEETKQQIITLVKELGLNTKEANAFTDYWIKVLPEAPYYAIRIIAQSTLDDISPLFINPAPATQIRVTLHFEPLDQPVFLKQPTIKPVHRNGFTAVEWGGIFKRSEQYPFSCFM